MKKLNIECLSALYLKAEVAFNDCITKKENDFLRNEIDIPISEVILTHEFVQVRISKYEMETFHIEVKIQLVSPNGDLIGAYFYYENEKGEGIDDRLVFY